jgi:phosphatidylglycerol lysyltransferase
MVLVTLRLLLTAAAVGTTGLALKAWLDAPHAWQPAGLAVARIVGPLILVLVAVTVPAIVRLIASPKRALRDVLSVTSAAGILLAIAAGSAELMMLSTLSLINLLLARRLWSQQSDRGATVQGWTLLGAAGIAALALLFFDHPKGALLLFFGALLVAAVGAAVWGLVLVVRNAPLPLESDRGPLRSVYREHAAAGISPFALMNDKRWFWSRDRKAFLAYGLRAGVAVVLGPGLGPAASLTALYREFRLACQSRGWKIGFYQVSDAVAHSLGWGVRRPIGSEAIVDLERLTLDGPTMAKLRHEVSRGQRNGVTVRLMSRSDVTPALREAMAVLAASWLGRHALGEMTFSVGCRADQPDARTTIGLAYDKDGGLVAYCSWLSLPGSRGIVLDEIRRTTKTPAGAMDLLLFTCMKQLAREASWASLGLAPVAAEPADRRSALSERALHRLGIASVSASLVSFKAKFQPRWEPRYVVAERAADWPALAVATLLLHYPDLDRRLQRVFPQVSWQRQARLAAALTGALLAAGISGIVVAAAQSREGHPLYQARLVAAQVSTNLPLTSSGAPEPSVSANHRPSHLTHHQPPTAGLVKAASNAPASNKVTTYERQATSAPQRPRPAAHPPQGPVHHWPHPAH